MNYKIRISPQAEIEIKTARDRYENQSLGLGEIFSGEIKMGIDSLINPIVDHKLVLKNLRRLLLHRFPYSVYYIRNEKDLVVHIMAVLHNRQSREDLARRL